MTTTFYPWFDLYSASRRPPGWLPRFCGTPRRADPDGKGLTGGLPITAVLVTTHVSHSIVEMVRRVQTRPNRCRTRHRPQRYSTKHSVVWSAPAASRMATDPLRQSNRLKSIHRGWPSQAPTGGDRLRDSGTDTPVVYDRDRRPRWTPIIAHLSDGQRSSAVTIRRSPKTWAGNVRQKNGVPPKPGSFTGLSYMIAEGDGADRTAGSGATPGSVPSPTSATGAICELKHAVCTEPDHEQFTGHLPASFSFVPGHEIVGIVEHVRHCGQ